MISSRMLMKHLHIPNTNTDPILQAVSGVLLWQPSLCIHLLLSSDPYVAAFLAVVCSSMVPINRGSTLRSILTPLGCEDFPGVRRSNKMISRRENHDGVHVTSHAEWFV